MYQLDAIRGFAALYIVCNHTLPKATLIAGREWYFFRYSHEVVILFFILSGFVIQYSYANALDQSFSNYFLRRFLRIYIPVIIIFIANYLLFVVNACNVAAPEWKTLFGNLLMFQNLSDLWQRPMTFTPFMNNVPLWTLSFEWWFYMFFFFVNLQWKQTASKYIYAIGMVSAISYIAYPFFLNRELMYFTIWWAGADAAKLYVNKLDINYKNMLKPLVSLATITLLLVVNFLLYKHNHPGKELFYATSPLVEIRHFGFAFIALLAAIVWKQVKWAGFTYTLGLFRLLAPLSFTLYISHWFMISNATYLNNFIENIYLRNGVYFIICCLFCHVVERVIYITLNKKILSFFSSKKFTLQKEVM